METSQIKNFAQALRNQLRDGVKQRLLYWGFNEKGEVNERPEAVEGGYMFRGEVFSDETVPNRWKQLKRMVDLHSIDYVIEEGAYTWFNRLMAIRILEKNDYIQPQLQYEEGTQLPHLLQNARRGIFPDMKDNELKQVKKQLRENRDNEAFARLLTHFCDTQPLISKVFGKISYSNDYTELLLPQNLLDQQGILDFIVTTDAITDEDFEQVELIGWLYQYYISEKKDEVFKSFKNQKKAGPEELPAATQIFTPEWIVRYMVENTVGRLWLELHPDSSLREKFEYFVEPAEENPKAEPIIEDVTDLTLLDPAAGSGHILVVGFEYLMDMYREEGYTARQSIEGILENNLYGLEIDERAAQLARFAVLLKAAKYDQSVLDGEQLPHIHSFSEQTHISTAEIREFLGSEGEPYVEEFKDALNILQEGKNLGSAIQLEISKKGVNFAQKRKEALQPEAVENLAVKQLLQKILPFIQVIDLLNKQYKAVAANPPYMGSGNMNGQLKTYLDDNYPSVSNDLMTTYMKVCSNIVEENGLWGLINIHTWLTKIDYTGTRDFLVNDQCIETLVHNGRGIFGSDFGTVTFSIRNRTPHEATKGIYRKLFDMFVKVEPPYKKKNRFLKREEKRYVNNQYQFKKLPGTQIGYWLDKRIFDVIAESSIKDYGDARQGIKTGKNDKFIRKWFEVDFNKSSLVKDDTDKWFPLDKGGDFRKWYGNNLHFLNWENDGYEIKNFRDYNGRLRSRPQNTQFFFEETLTFSTSASYRPSFRYSSHKFAFESSGSNFIPNSNDEPLREIMGFLNSDVGEYLIEVFSLGKGITEGAVKSLPYIDPKNESIKKLVERNIAIAKKDWDSREVSWDFRTSPLLIESTSLEIAVKKWKNEVEENYLELHSNEEKINQIFIDTYRLQDELDFKVAFKDVTILEEEINSKNIEEYQKKCQEKGSKQIDLPINTGEVIKKLISFAVGCFMGRYRLDKEGLFIASPSSKNKNDLKYEVQYPLLDEQSANTESVEIDDDGLIPLIGSDGPFSDDVVYRMKNFIRIIWGEQNLTENLNYIQKKLGNGLEKFLTDNFWSYHTKLYSKRPIYWLFSSKNGAFKVLAYMHRMDKYSVQKVRQNYLHPYMDYLRNEIDKLEGRDSLNSDESKQLDTYRSNLNECLEYDEVIKEVADKQIDFDLDDGVKHNYELFGNALAKI